MEKGFNKLMLKLRKIDVKVEDKLVVIDGKVNELKKFMELPSEEVMYGTMIVDHTTGGLVVPPIEEVENGGEQEEGEQEEGE
ncbi:unnamed protein product [Cochlearia groenlandica]